LSKDKVRRPGVVVAAPTAVKTASKVKKPKAKVIRYADVPFKPRFAYGDQCQIGALCGAAMGTELAFGFARFTKARIPWTIHYDEMLFVVHGQITIHCNGKALRAGPHDSIWLPAGTELIYEAEDCLTVYAVHPADWSSRKAPA
jgi:ethanolamine utilization protein EutQ